MKKPKARVKKVEKKPDESQPDEVVYNGEVGKDIGEDNLQIKASSNDQAVEDFFKVYTLY